LPQRGKGWVAAYPAEEGEEKKKAMASAPTEKVKHCGEENCEGGY